ncbi:MAG TPA: glycosyltransferase family 9 protein [Mucilaginibacter sp.]|jgi:lipopolysaccharide heptosyltransferase II
MTNWESCKNILCILPDNVGDLIMTGPALGALKESFGAHITVIASPKGEDITKHMPEIDDTMIFDLPWMKVQDNSETTDINWLVEEIKQRKFDAAVIFTMYNQNSTPAALLCYLAGIPKRLAYCSENPYQLLTDWIPDREPEWDGDREHYSFIKHQVKRGLDLVKTVNAIAGCERFALKKNEESWSNVKDKLASIGVDTDRKWILMHPGVNDIKREYPSDKWIDAGREIIEEFDCQVIFTGSSDEKAVTDYFRDKTSPNSFSAAGLFNLNEFILLIDRSPLVISVNTGAIHIASAVSTPVVVLYALTTPQRTPWRSPCKVLKFGNPENLSNRNEIVGLANNRMFNAHDEMPSANDILKAAWGLLKYTSPEFAEPTLKHTG